jgi:CheY-like chemotaxis protein
MSETCPVERLTILLVEDSDCDRFLFEWALSMVAPEIGLQVVGSGEEAIAYVQGKQKFADRNEYPFPWLLITDLRMPRTDGFGVLQQLRRTGLPFVPAILLSGSLNHRDVKMAYRLGANSYLKKSDTHDGLIRLLDTLITFWKASVVPEMKAVAPAPMGVMINS